jgi:uncharacterized SAM-binding protein YcdF (DUF218 family)
MNMFFYMSKIFWFFIDPSNLLLMAICLGTVLIYRRRDKLGRRLLSFTAVMAVIIATAPIGRILLVVLENRFPTVQTLPGKVDGIIVLGGVVDEVVTKARGQISIGGAVERLIYFAAFSKQYPDAKLLFTSGSGKLLSQNIKEGDVVGSLLTDLGVDVERLIIENQSRNTYENVRLSKQLVQPITGETWILITSAFHMPRSVGIFRQVGWDVLPFPVDYHLKGDLGLALTFNLIGGISSLSLAIHEWLGLLVYWLTNKSNAFFPGPNIRATFPIALDVALWQKSVRI